MTDFTREKRTIDFLRFQIRGRPRNLKKGVRRRRDTVQSGVIDKGQKKIGGLRAKRSPF